MCVDSRDFRQMYDMTIRLFENTIDKGMDSYVDQGFRRRMPLHRVQGRDSEAQAREGKR